MEALGVLLDKFVAPRAAEGIPPIDIGDRGDSHKKQASYKLAAISRITTGAKTCRRRRREHGP